MQVTETASNGLKRELKVVIDAEELNKRLSERLDQIQQTARLKGFRPGKVPVSHLRKVYGRSVMAEVVQNAVAETSQQALTEREERPAYQPEIVLPEDKDEIERVITGNADLAFTMSFEVLPQIEVTDFSKMEVERQVADVEEAEIDRGVEQLVEASTAYAAKEGAAETGDRVTIDFEGKIDGEPFEGGKAEDASVVLGAGRFIPGFEEGLMGVKAGETRTIKTTFPEEYPAAHLAGKEASFDITVKEVAGPVKPEINDEFAKTVGFESVEKLREAVKGKLAGELAAAARMKVKRQLLDAMDEAHRFELPQALVDNEFDMIWRQVTSDLERAGRTFEDEKTTEEKAKDEYRKLAERRVRLGLVLSEIGTKNEIRVQDEELQRALLERIRQFPGQERQVYEYYQKNPEALAELRAPIYEDKVIDYILELAKVTEKKVSAKELFQDDDDHDHEHGHDHDHDHDHGHDHKHD